MSYHNVVDVDVDRALGGVDGLVGVVVVVVVVVAVVVVVYKSFVLSERC